VLLLLTEVEVQAYQVLAKRRDKVHEIRHIISLYRAVLIVLAGFNVLEWDWASIYPE